MLNINYLPNSIAATLFTTSPCFCAMVTCPVYGIRILNNFVLHTYINKEATNWKVYIHGIEFKLLRVYMYRRDKENIEIALIYIL